MSSVSFCSSHSSPPLSSSAAGVISFRDFQHVLIHTNRFNTSILLTLVRVLVLIGCNFVTAIVT